MTWSRVKWSEANQVLDLLAVPQERRAPAAVASPAEYFALLRGETRRQEAAEFLAQALPRLEAAAWAARTVRDATAGGGQRTLGHPRAPRRPALGAGPLRKPPSRRF